MPGHLALALAEVQVHGSVSPACFVWTLGVPALLHPCEGFLLVLGQVSICLQTTDRPLVGCS